MNDTNVELGMIPHRKGCRCDECEAEKWRTHYEDAHREVGILNDEARELRDEIERLRSDLDHRERIIANHLDHISRLQADRRDSILFLKSISFKDGDAGSRLMGILDDKPLPKGNSSND